MQARSARVESRCAKALIVESCYDVAKKMIRGCYLWVGYRVAVSVFDCLATVVRFSRFFAGIRVLPSCFMRCPCAGRHLLFFAAAKKSRQKKAAHTVSASYCLRASNGSYPSHGNFSVPARCQRRESRPHPLQSPVEQTAAANGLHRSGGKLCVGRSAAHVSALTTPTLLSSPKRCAYGAKAYTQFADIERVQVDRACSDAGA
jgi:hypothetical protein